VSTVDRARIEAAVSEILEAIGEAPQREGLVDTPRRVADSFSELFAGVGADPAAAFGSTFPSEPGAQPVIVRDITFRSVCEHHLLPFEGVVHAAYRPGALLAGLGGIVAVIESASSRPQLQERLTEQVAEALERGLGAQGVLVVVEARHGCVSARGRRQTLSSTVTIAARGSLTEPAARAELMALLSSGPAPDAPTSAGTGSPAAAPAEGAAT
jgi:GTP cyclohydrolase I